MIRSIEKETYADNPPLFREYMAAPADIRALMDNQFRNVKTHSRLLSKATWYEWRMKLLEGLKEGLKRHVVEMKGDDELLAKHEALVSEVMPQLTERHAQLQSEAASLQQLTDDLENCDQEELRRARERLSDTETDVELKQRQLRDLQAEVQHRTETVETAAALKEEYTAQIKEAERVREECRGWSAREIRKLRTSVLSLERQTGWSILSASPSKESPVGPQLEMSYRGQLSLSFYPGAFLGASNAAVDDGKRNMPVKLVFAPRTTSPEVRPSSARLSPIGSFVLKAISDHISSAQQRTVTPRQLLQFVAQTWDQYFMLEEEARMLEFCGVTKLGLVEDTTSQQHPTSSLRARCTLLSRALGPRQQKRIDIDFSVKASIDSNNDGVGIGTMHFETVVMASKVYGFGTENGGGDGLSEGEMLDILHAQLGLGKNEVKKTKSILLGDGSWRNAVQELAMAVF